MTVYKGSYFKLLLIGLILTEDHFFIIFHIPILMGLQTLLKST